MSILIVFSGTFVAGLVWELFEAVSDALFQTKEWGVYGEYIVSDTYRDILFNTLGTIMGIMLFALTFYTTKKTVLMKSKS